MNQALLGVVLLVQCVGLVVMVWKRKPSDGTGDSRSSYEALEKSQARLESLVREEMATSRREASEQARTAREESQAALSQLPGQMAGVAQSNREAIDRLHEKVFAMLNSFGGSLGKELQQFVSQEHTRSEKSREQNAAALKAMSEAGRSLESLVRQEMEAARQQSAEQTRIAREEVQVVIGRLLEQVAGAAQSSAEANERFREKVDALGLSLSTQLQEFAALERAQSDKLRQENMSALKGLGDWLGQHLASSLKLSADAQRDQLGAFELQLRTLDQVGRQSSRELREEVSGSFAELSRQLAKQLSDASALQTQQFESFEARLAELERESGVRWDAKRAEDAASSAQVRRDVQAALEVLGRSVTENVSALGKAQSEQVALFASRIDVLAHNVDERLRHLQEDNSQKLDQMRQTVDEKLQGTLDQRLGESFRQVSERLEMVHRGLGEMQTLANGVGDLKKVLSNVKTRGNWGEMQLGNLLEQMLSHHQFERNVATIPGSAERVEFAIRLPGREVEQEAVWLPIDAKFPQEDYIRLVEAQERGDVEAIEAHGKQLELQIKKCAQDVCTKYIQAPHTTDFGIVFLPTEGLYAEVIRRAGLVEKLQRDCRVTIAGPTTLAAILNSLQMGFRTLAIQKRSSEVWETLSSVKTEFTKYGEVLDSVQKKLQEASNKIEATQVRRRAIQRKLRGVDGSPEDDYDSRPVLRAKLSHALMSAEDGAHFDEE